MRLKLMSWLTLLNDNGQSFPDAELMAVAGRLNVTSDYESLGESPEAEPLRLVCYPLGHTWTGSPAEFPDRFPPPPPPPAAPAGIVVTAERLQRKDYESNSPIVAMDAAMLAKQEELGDLKLYRLPEHVTVAAKGLKQVAFLEKDAVRGKLMYQSDCNWWVTNGDPDAAEMRFETVNDEKHGLGVALPTGGITFFEPSSHGDLFVGEQQVRDYASGQDVEIPLGDSAQVFAACARVGRGDPSKDWVGIKATLTNANPHAVTFRLRLGSPLRWHVRGLKATRLKDGETVAEFVIPANGRREIAWEVRQPGTS